MHMIDSSMEITLRPYSLSDIDDFIEWASDDEVILWSRLTHLPTKDDALRYLKEFMIPQQQHQHQWCRAVCLDGKPVGFILVVRPTGIHESAGRCRGQMAYALGRKYWGRGIMPEAVKMALRAAFKETPEMKRIEAVVNVKNLRSMRVLEKVGFSREGVLRKYIVIHGKVTDVVMFSILSTELHYTC
ncbi:hypothetical protein Dimus_004846 [Dionaea muscipula]